MPIADGGKVTRWCDTAATARALSGRLSAAVGAHAAASEAVDFDTLLGHDPLLREELGSVVPLVTWDNIMQPHTTQCIADQVSENTSTHDDRAEPAWSQTTASSS